MVRGIERREKCFVGVTLHAAAGYTFMDDNDNAIGDIFVAPAAVSQEPGTDGVGKSV